MARLAWPGAETPDLVLMDLFVPCMTGFEAVRRLRDGDKTRSIPVIAVSVHDSAGDYEEAHEAGCEGFRASRSLPACSSNWWRQFSPAGGRP